MRADLARFFEDVDVLGGERRLLIRRGVLFDQVGQVQCTSETRRARAYNQDIGFECFPLHRVL